MQRTFMNMLDHWRITAPESNAKVTASSLPLQSGDLMSRQCSRLNRWQNFHDDFSMRVLRQV